MNNSSAPVIPPLIFAHASVHSIGGISLFEPWYINKNNIQNYYSETYVVSRAVQMLQAAGFIIMGINGITISIGAPAEVYERTFITKLRAKEMPTVKGKGQEDVATFILPDDSNLQGVIDMRKTAFRNVLEGVSINEPVYYNNFIAPKQNYWHLSVPGDVSAGLNADKVHRLGITGRGINVVMVDSGWYSHPYFLRKGYAVNPAIAGPGANNPFNDEAGHGTGESANLFAIAPDVNFTMVKMSFVDSAGALNTAVRLNPHVISCSWGSNKQVGPLTGNDQVLSAAVANAVNQGITVVFSAGNGQWGFPGQHPDVISAGGVYVDNNLTLSASDYSSGFASSIFPGRQVPDVCGLVGMRPSAAYIMLPVPPGIGIDTEYGGGAYPLKDETLPYDGWAAFSGTSAAAPQIAGICALLKQAKPSLTPVQIKQLLQITAYDVTLGNCSPGTGANPAAAGPDLATGYGLSNAYAAVTHAL